MRSVLWITLLFIMAIPSRAQRECVNASYLQLQLKNDTLLSSRLRQQDLLIDTRIQARKIRSGVAGQVSPSPIIKIPVVVHILYNSSSDNISDAQVLSQLSVLNQDFRRLNA